MPECRQLTCHERMKIDMITSEEDYYEMSSSSSQDSEDSISSVTVDLEEMVLDEGSEEQQESDSSYGTQAASTVKNAKALTSSRCKPQP